MLTVFCSLGLAFGAVAAFSRDFRYVILSLWAAGMCVGAVDLTLGAEFLAVLQWIISTLTAISFCFFAVMFGKYRAAPAWRGPRFSWRWLAGIASGLLFVVAVGLGSNDILFSATPVSAGNDLVSLGKSITQDHLLAVELAALSLFMGLIGAGVIARPRGDGEGET